MRIRALSLLWRRIRGKTPVMGATYRDAVIPFTKEGDE